MVNRRLKKLSRPEISPTAYAVGLAHARVGAAPPVTAAAAVSEPQPHLAASGVVIGNMNVLYASRVGGITASPAFELCVDAAIRATNVHRLALCVERHASRASNPRVPNARDRMRAGTSCLDRRQLGLQRSGPNRPNSLAMHKPVQ